MSIIVRLTIFGKCSWEQFSLQVKGAERLLSECRAETEQKQGWAPSLGTENEFTLPETSCSGGGSRSHSSAYPQFQELSEDSGHMRGSGRDWGTVVSWQTMQTAQVTRERLKKKTKQHLTICHSTIIREVKTQTFKGLTLSKRESWLHLSVQIWVEYYLYLRQIQ